MSSSSAHKRRRPDAVESAPANKRTRGATATATFDDDMDGEDRKVVLPPKGTPVEELGFDPFAPHPGMTKEQRKVARMIRNRTAAQVSRDRKKEHVTELEDRVRELESQLSAFRRGSSSSSTLSGSPLPVPPSDLPAFSVPFPAPTTDQSSGSQDRSSSPSPSHLSLSSSHTSTISPLQAASLSQARISSLEEENELLKKRLEEGDREKAELKGRLEGVEKRFEWMERVLNGVVGIASSSSQAPASAPAPAPTPGPSSSETIDWTSLLSSFATPASPNPTDVTGHHEVGGRQGGDVVGKGEKGADINERLVAREVALQRTLMLALSFSSPKTTSSPSLLLPLPHRRPRLRPVSTRSSRRQTNPVRSISPPFSTLACSTSSPRRPRRQQQQQRRLHHWSNGGTTTRMAGCGRIRLVVKPPTRS